ncbi:MAG: helix-turn-helix transcriptional regulator [Gemmatimonadota bacterium]|jgi:DNA-binding CsgD family transcriptional regulator
MDHSDRDRLGLVLGVAVVSIVVGGSVDLYLDRPESWLSFHVAFETLLIAGALVMATTLWLGWWRSARSVGQLRRSLEARKDERDAWRSSAEQALEGLGRAIGDQLARWDLTPAEREVALMLLKGYSHKAIAKHTDRSPQTVRQHATAVYRKASVGGRAELSAFFLEDLMLPEQDRTVVRLEERENGPPGPQSSPR